MKEHFWRRMASMLVGIFLLGLGISLFAMSNLGNEASSGFAMAFSDRIGLDFSVGLIIVNTVYFLSEILFARKLIGIGTFVNWFCVGISSTVWDGILGLFMKAPEGMPSRIFVMAAGVLVISFAAALYQTADVGIAPYDALSLAMADRLPVRYFFCRMCTDCCCAAAAWLLGGVIGLGTVICALGLGPFISFFTRTVAEPLCGIRRR